MNEETRAYKHSGRLGSGPIVGPLIGIVAASVLAIAYAYADVYIPVAGYFSVVLTVAFAGGVGYAISKAMVAAKCRSTGFAKFLGFVVGLIALYFSWAAFVFVLIQRDLSAEMEVSLIKLFLNPEAVWNIVLLVNADGWYSIRGGTPSGVTLWIFWGIEAVIIAGGISLISGMGIADLVFCERCHRWCDMTEGFMRLGFPPDENLMARLAAGELSALGELPVVPVTATPYVRIDLGRCKSCSDMASWQATLITHEQTKEGKLEEKTDKLTSHQLLLPEQLTKLEALAAREPIEETAATEEETE